MRRLLLRLLGYRVGTIRLKLLDGTLLVGSYDHLGNVLALNTAPLGPGDVVQLDCLAIGPSDASR